VIIHGPLRIRLPQAWRVLASLAAAVLRTHRVVFHDHLRSFQIFVAAVR